MRIGWLVPILLAGSISGCGGGGGGGGGGGAQVGSVEVLVDWPDRGRYVPPYANSLVATITAASVQYQSTLNRTGDLGYRGAILVASNIPVGTHQLQVEAFTDINGAGTKVAVGSRQVTVVATKVTSVAVSGDLQTTIDHLIIDGQPLTVYTGDQLQITGHAEDINNALLLIPSTAFTWSVTQGGAFGSITTSGLFTANTAGTATIRMAEEGAQREVTVSVVVSDPPEWFVFHRSSPGSPYLLWRMYVNGTGLTQLTFDIGQLGDRHATRSPDGTKILFTRMPQGSIGRGNICVINSDGSGFLQITTGGDDDEATWSPDGSKIAFHRGDPEQIWTMNADGSGQVQLTNTNYNIQPSWSPDGTKIAFQGNPISMGDDIYVMNSDGSNVLQLTNAAGQDGYPCWTRDGRILFQSEGRRGIYIMNADGTNQVELIPFGTWSFMYQCSVSLDGTKIVCEVDIAPGGGDREILIFDSNGGLIANLSNSPTTSDFHPSFRGSP